MRTYTIIEERGYRIEYPYQTTISLTEAIEIADEMNKRAQTDEFLRNGNNDPYTYRVE
jgi:hypothetical protein